MVPLKYLNNFWRTLEISNYNTISTANCVIFNVAAGQATAFTITDTELYIPVVTLSTQDNAKLLQLLKSGFKRTFKWNRYQPKKQCRTLQSNIYII